MKRNLMILAIFLILISTIFISGCGNQKAKLSITDIRKDTLPENEGLCHVSWTISVHNSNDISPENARVICDFNWNNPPKYEKMSKEFYTDTAMFWDNYPCDNIPEMSNCNVVCDNCE